MVQDGQVGQVDPHSGQLRFLHVYIWVINHSYSDKSGHIMEFSLNYDLAKFSKLAKNFDHWPKRWWELNPGPRFISLMLYQMGHRAFCTTYALNNHQFIVLPRMTDFAKLS